MAFPFSVTDAAYKIVKVNGATDEVLARADNYEIGKAAFDKALFVYPQDHLELRQGARIILKSKEPPPGNNQRQRERHGSPIDPLSDLPVAPAPADDP